MFGFIRPARAELRIREADRFQQIYCGLCNAIHTRYGFFYTLFLRYDMAFFALLYGSNRNTTVPSVRKRCAAHPLYGRLCVPMDDNLSLAADLSVLLTYYKFCDSAQDEKGIGRLLARTLRRLGQNGYEKAKKRLPAADAEMQRALADLHQLENQKCDSMDRVADASARLTAAMIPPVQDVRTRILRQMFYQIGRWIYLLDGIQDLAEDLQNGNYNPIASRYSLQTPDMTVIKQQLETTLARSLADVCMAFDLLDIQRDADLIRNIIFLGMPVVTRQVLDGTYQTNGGWGKHGSL